MNLCGGPTDSPRKSGYSGEEYVDSSFALWYFFNTDGAVAQMGERVTGSHKVRGSIPLSSTNDIKGLANRG